MQLFRHQPPIPHSISRASARVRIASLVAVVGCGAKTTACGASPTTAPDASPPRWRQGPSLPVAVSNNAVAAYGTNDDCRVFSMMGIGAARTQAAITSSAYRFADGAWSELPPVPGPPRVAASAIAVGKRIFVVGGYSVADNGSETTSNRIDIWDDELGAWSEGTPLAKPIDDAVMALWREHTLVIVSGWSVDRSIADVTLVDTRTGGIQAATPFPGAPAFGAHGGIVGDSLWMFDGVATVNGRFTLTPQAWRGELDPSNPTAIAWTATETLPPSRYRAATATFGDRLLIVGGTSQPYNFNGLTYTGNKPAEPLADAVWVSAAPEMQAAGSPQLRATQSSERHQPYPSANRQARGLRSNGSIMSEPAPQLPVATMDHRSLGACGSRAYIVGGMIAAGMALGDRSGPLVSGSAREADIGPIVTSNVWMLD